jgi:hypothetical protein
MESINAVFAPAPPESADASLSKGIYNGKPVKAPPIVESGEEKSEEKKAPLLTDRYEHAIGEEKTGYSEFARYRRVERVDKYPADTPLGVPSPIAIYSAIEELTDRIESEPETPAPNLTVLIDLYNRLVDRIEDSSY